MNNGWANGANKIVGQARYAQMKYVRSKKSNLNPDNLKKGGIKKHFRLSIKPTLVLG